jgi:hypothetical protein
VYLTIHPEKEKQLAILENTFSSMLIIFLFKKTDLVTTLKESGRPVL